MQTFGRYDNPAGKQITLNVNGVGNLMGRGVSNPFQASEKADFPKIGQRSTNGSTREQRLQGLQNRMNSMKQSPGVTNTHNRNVNRSLNLTNEDVSKIKAKIPTNQAYINTSRNHPSAVNKTFDHPQREKSNILPSKNTKNLLQNKSHIWPCPYAEKKKAAPSKIPNQTPTKNLKSRNHNGRALMTENKKVRPLPVHSKEDVFDEWGAIVRQQDEIDLKIQQQQFEKMKQRQVDYKKELDKQFRELQNRKKGVLGEKMKREDDLIKYQEKLQDQKALAEENKRIKMMQNQKTDAMAGLSELESRKQQNKMMRDMEMKMQREKLNMEKKKQEELRRNQIALKKKEESDYKNVLANQAREKKKKKKKKK